jgi:tRNA(fMet)-specific endonuclease VapC
VKELILFDTDVLSYLFKGDTRADAYQDILRDYLPSISFMTVAELELWALIHRWGNVRRLAMEEYLEGFLVVPYDRFLCRAWATVCHQSRHQGRAMHPSDVWIAATALTLDVPLLTHNLKDFGHIDGLRLMAE